MSPPAGADTSRGLVSLGAGGEQASGRQAVYPSWSVLDRFTGVSLEQDIWQRSRVLVSLTARIVMHEADLFPLLATSAAVYGHHSFRLSK
jgi:hypothetical protein